MKDRQSIDELMDLIKVLRGPNGCPWDRKQDLQSAKDYVLEEAYEVVDAVIRKDHEAICEESGDLLFQLLFLVNLEDESGYFGLRDAISGVKEKMIRRHPHVFKDTKVNGVEDVIYNWKKIKESENSSKKNLDYELPLSLPGSLRILKAMDTAKANGSEISSDEMLYKLRSISNIVFQFEDKDLPPSILKALFCSVFLYAYSKGIDIESILIEISNDILKAISSSTDLKALVNIFPE